MAATPPGQPAGAPSGPPMARRIPSERTHHGDTVIDEYAWLADAQDPETLRYLEAENAYTAAMTAGQAGPLDLVELQLRADEPETKAGALADILGLELQENSVRIGASAVTFVSGGPEGRPELYGQPFLWIGQHQGQ